MGTRTAPAYTSPPPFLRLTLHLIDASGDQSSDTMLINPASTPVQIEAYIDAYQATSQASIWKVSASGEAVGDADPDNATTDQRSSVKDGINMLYRNSVNLAANTQRVVAPVTTVMQGNQDIPLLTGTALEPLVVAMLAIQPATLSLQSMQYTERRERANNARIKV
jgi:hypothetical protein